MNNVGCVPSYTPLVSWQAPEWLLPLLELALHEAPPDSGLPEPPRLALALDAVEHSGAWLQLAEAAVAEAEALLSPFGVGDCFT